MKDSRNTGSNDCDLHGGSKGDKELNIGGLETDLQQKVDVIELF